jgi:hypothetical protein
VNDAVKASLLAQRPAIVDQRQLNAAGKSCCLHGWCQVTSHLCKESGNSTFVGAKWVGGRVPAALLLCKLPDTLKPSLRFLLSLGAGRNQYGGYARWCYSPVQAAPPAPLQLPLCPHGTGCDPWGANGTGPRWRTSLLLMLDAPNAANV